MNTNNICDDPNLLQVYGDDAVYHGNEKPDIMGIFSEIPLELFEMILKRIDIISIINLSMTCKAFQGLSEFVRIEIIKKLGCYTKTHDSIFKPVTSIIFPNVKFVGTVWDNRIDDSATEYNVVNFRNFNVICDDTYYGYKRWKNINILFSENNEVTKIVQKFDMNILDSLSVNIYENLRVKRGNVLVLFNKIKYILKETINDLKKLEHISDMMTEIQKRGYKIDLAKYRCYGLNYSIKKLNMICSAIGIK